MLDCIDVGIRGEDGGEPSIQLGKNPIKSIKGIDAWL
jgi:hypothetical protein